MYGRYVVSNFFTVGSMCRICPAWKGPVLLLIRKHRRCCTLPELNFVSSGAILFLYGERGEMSGMERRVTRARICLHLGEVAVVMRLFSEGVGGSLCISALFYFILFYFMNLQFFLCCKGETRQEQQ